MPDQPSTPTGKRLAAWHADAAVYCGVSEGALTDEVLAIEAEAVSLHHTQGVLRGDDMTADPIAAIEARDAEMWPVVERIRQRPAPAASTDDDYLEAVEDRHYLLARLREVEQSSALLFAEAATAHAKVKAERDAAMARLREVEQERDAALDEAAFWKEEVRLRDRRASYNADLRGQA
jgi:hypothetical protein